MQESGNAERAEAIFADPPVLRTERLVLRQITESDGEGLFRRVVIYPKDRPAAGA